MSVIYLLQNQHDEFLDKSGEWVLETESKSLYRTEHKDEAINLKVEHSVKKPDLRIRLAEAKYNDKGKLELSGGDFKAKPATAPEQTEQNDITASDVEAEAENTSNTTPDNADDAAEMTVAVAGTAINDSTPITPEEDLLSSLDTEISKSAETNAESEPNEHTSDQNISALANDTVEQDDATEEEDVPEEAEEDAAEEKETKGLATDQTEAHATVSPAVESQNPGPDSDADSAPDHANEPANSATQTGEDDESTPDNAASDSSIGDDDTNDQVTRLELH